MIDYIQIRMDGDSRPLHFDQWHPWHGAKDEEREVIRNMAAHRFIRDSGISRDRERMNTFTVYHWREGDPLHENGRPKTCHATTYVCNPK